MIRMMRRAVTCFVCAAVITGPAFAQEQKRIMSSKFWSAFSTDGPNGKVCWAATSPVDAEFSGGQRGDVPDGRRHESGRRCDGHRLCRKRWPLDRQILASRLYGGVQRSREGLSVN